MRTHKATRTDRLELIERSLLGLALLSGVFWAVAGGSPLAQALF